MSYLHSHPPRGALSSRRAAARCVFLVGSWCSRKPSAFPFGGGARRASALKGRGASVPDGRGVLCSLVDAFRRARDRLSLPDTPFVLAGPAPAAPAYPVCVCVSRGAVRVLLARARSSARLPASPCLTSNQVRLPAEFKHITKRRKRN